MSVGIPSHFPRIQLPNWNLVRYLEARSDEGPP